jgi:hypothetical protein
MLSTLLSCNPLPHDLLQKHFVIGHRARSAKACGSLFLDTDTPC